MERTVALVGLMGVGKSTVGRRLAHQVGASFVDADEEIVIAAGRPIADIFAER
ncbi:MAG: shikimate kinase, partial [Hyphomonadaceae bacterium]|nr:shikimate kinase [Hyphomonadaceae bacterium]